MANELNQAKFNDPPGGNPSDRGPQINNAYYWKQALIEAKKLQFFMQLADVTAMPKNFGKTIKRFHYMPLLDDRNINDQGIDAAGVTIANGNLYGSSKDIGTITGKLPVLSEAGGRVNRVGFKRIDLQGSIEKFGFFDEYTQESVDFDSDAELMQHISREMINGAHEITEDALMIDVINSAGVLRYAGAATTKATVSDTDVVTYADLVRLNVDLDNNRCPKHTTISTGTRMIDTKVIPSARVLYTATEMLPTLKAMTDLHGNQAFIGVEKYAAGTTTLNGEVGMIDQFRIVIHPEMVRWAGAGAATTNGTVYSTNGKVDVFPMVVVGDQSFTTIGFQTDGQTVKFKITHKKPGEETASQLDPYGETGFMSIKWYYGFMALRPERIAVIHTAAKM
jgi:N4-gp56 family major capsid protein